RLRTAEAGADERGRQEGLARRDVGFVRCVARTPMQEQNTQPWPRWLGTARHHRITPMTRDEVLRRLAEGRAELAQLGVRSLDLFGSVARGEAGPQSDVDLLVDFDEAVGLFHFFRVQRRLEEMLGRRVDLVMRDAVKPQL